MKNQKDNTIMHEMNLNRRRRRRQRRAKSKCGPILLALWRTYSRIINYNICTYRTNGSTINLWCDSHWVGKFLLISNHSATLPKCSHINPSNNNNNNHQRQRLRGHAFFVHFTRKKTMPSSLWRNYATASYHRENVFFFARGTWWLCRCLKNEWNKQLGTL